MKSFDTIAIVKELNIKKEKNICLLCIFINRSSKKDAVTKWI